ncbi:hypothetical protein [Mangrovibacterium marinum]|uniref:Secreted protein (Por secretion system target) n=1 Tax=Mangrovibacterium marinum TaxID=1639118 RepID=A0A2T5C630_9BACT|nr:hypothetical protein [Mangrovibacterium marinum]PTN10362.1 hypothetical protein C8N47_10110 [Mangrovibacterium marinum]
MKTIIAVIALVASANIAFATGNLRVDILPLSSERAVVAVSSQTESQYEISIENAYGEVIYYKETEGNVTDYRKVYDFSKLEQGEYKVIATIDGATSQRLFTVGSNEIAVGKLKYVADPVFTFKDDVLRVAYLNYPGEQVDLKIYDGNQLIYSKAINSEFAVNEGLNLSKLRSGNYQVVLASENEVFDYTVRK